MADIFNSESFLYRLLAALLAVIAFPVMAAGQFNDMELIHYSSTVDSFHPVTLNAEQNEKGDTVFCSRKGRVAALPGVKGNTFRITDSHSLEILHDDGTLMVYGNLSSILPAIRQGMIVYPGQALAVAQESFILTQHLVSLGSSEQLQAVPILYLFDETTGAQFSRIEGRTAVLHPESIIIREMTPREIRLREKNSGQPR